jgi:hypothetical protein
MLGLEDVNPLGPIQKNVKSPVPPVAVPLNVAKLPPQIVWLAGVMRHITGGVMTKVALHVVTHPAVSMMVAV